MKLQGKVRVLALTLALGKLGIAFGGEKICIWGGTFVKEGKIL